MPVVACRIEAGGYRDIQRLIDAGEYASVQEFVELAVRNQLALEGATERISYRPAGGETQPEPRLQVDTPAQDASHRLAAAFALPSADRIALPPFVKPTQISERAIWGQINRIVPLKLAARRVAVLANGSNTWPTVDSVLRDVGETAALVGSCLHDADVASGRKRELLATGVPRVDSPDSKQRFLAQTIARVVRSGTTHPGAIAAYGIATVTNSGVALTSTGIEFAMLESPVLDRDPRTARETLSVEECRFFLRFVVPHVPVELTDLNLVAGTIDKGAMTPEALHSAVAATFHARRWTGTMVRTHLSGLVSRLIELMVVVRTWEGRNASYALGPLADELPRSGKNGERDAS